MTTTAASSFALCYLMQGADPLDLTNTGYQPSGAYVWPSLLGSVTLSSPGLVTLECSSNVDDGVRMYGISLAAIKVGTLTHQ